VTDGLSHTALFSERVVGDQDPSQVTSWRDVYMVAPSSTLLMTAQEAEERCRSLTTAISHYSSAGRAWVAGSYQHSAYNHVLPPNSPVPDCASLSDTTFTGAMTARSLHPGGVNVCFGDASVRFVSQAIDLELWRALGTMYGAEIISDSSL
jgi:prepilin-type processing-associated H-X9-DG protein